MVTQKKVKVEKSIYFPAVSFCNKFPFTNDTENYTKKILDNQKRREENGLPPIGSLPDSQNSRISTMEAFYVVQTNISTLDDRIKRSFSVPIDEFIISCTYNQKKCDINEFDWYYDKLLGFIKLFIKII